MRSIPLISGENNDVRGGSKGESNYQRILETLALNASNKIDGLDRLHDTRNSSKGGGGGGDDEQTIHTTTSQTSYMSMTSSGTRMTSGQRRRWHKQQQQQQQQQQMQMMMMQGTSSTMLAPHIEETTNVVATSFVTGRQQSHICSQPYLCEVFHDTYGIGSTPPRGLVNCPGYSSMWTRESGTEFYTPVCHITELHVFNTARDCYGGAAAAAVTITKKDDGSGI
jgi:hypothetical protein